jgi:hypothetical protein
MRSKISAEEAAKYQEEQRQMLAALVAAQRERRARDKLAAQPEVGVIFLVGDNLFIDATPLSKTGYMTAWHTTGRVCNSVATSVNREHS